jgi:CRISPR system Cascade subunit CasB
MSVESLMQHLEAVASRDDRGALAALRRGLGEPPGAAPEMHPHVAPHLPDDGWTWTNRCCYAVAALFGLHARSASDGNMGTTFRAIAAAEGERRGEASESLEKRFVALLKCSRDDLFDHLRHAVSLARGHEAPVNWRGLLRDCRHWNSPDRWVQREWARAFWGSAGRSGEREPDTEAAATGA